MHTQPEALLNDDFPAQPLRAVPGLYSTYPGIQIAAQTRDSATDEDLQFFQQLGVEWGPSSYPSLLLKPMENTKPL